MRKSRIHVNIDKFDCVRSVLLSQLGRMQPRKSVAHEETQSNRVLDFRDFVCSLFPKAIFFFTFILLSQVAKHTTHFPF